MKKQSQKLIAASVFVLALGVCGLVKAQTGQLSTAVQTNQTSKIALYKASPVWKDMIDDPNANYFEVQKAFQLFWEGKELPMGEDDIIGERRRLKDNFVNRILNAKELKEQQERESLVFDCKRYENWLIMVEPYVQEDGRILSDTEKLELWKKHYEELEQR